MLHLVPYCTKGLQAAVEAVAHYHRTVQPLFFAGDNNPLVEIAAARHAHFVDSGWNCKLDGNNGGGGLSSRSLLSAGETGCKVMHLPEGTRMGQQHWERILTPGSPFDGTVASLVAAWQNAPAWCANSSWRPGFCEWAPSAGGDCERGGNMGSWAGIASAAACAARCRGCARCAYVSYSPNDHDCSWFRRCPGAGVPGKRRSLHWERVDSGHCTLAVRHGSYRGDGVVQSRQAATTVTTFTASTSTRAGMRVRSGPVHVVVAADSNQWRGLPAVIRSVGRNARAPENVHFHVMTGSGELSALRRYLKCHDIDGEPSARRMKVDLVAYNASIVGALPTTHSTRTRLNSAANFARFWIARLLPSASKAIWLDADVILVSPVEELWEVALTGVHKSVLYAFPKRSSWKPVVTQFVGARLEKVYQARYGRSFADHCTTRTNAWNAGVHVVNLDRFRDEPAVISDVDWVQKEQIINPSQLTQPISIMLACRYGW